MKKKAENEKTGKRENVSAKLTAYRKASGEYNRDCNTRFLKSEDTRRRYLRYESARTFNAMIRAYERLIKN